jgi:integrase
MGKVAFTKSRVDGFRCPPDREQAFLWDTGAPGLALRSTPAGKPAFVFQSRYLGQSVRVTIGNPDAWSIPEAQAKARALQREIDEGRDPRGVKAEAVAAAKAQAKQAAAEALLVSEAWARYMAEGKPARKDAWKPRYVADLQAAAAPGGEARKRGKGQTLPGHLWPLMGERLADVNADLIRDWYAREAKRSPRQAARSAAMFSGFLRWCSLQRELRDLVDARAASADALRDLLPGKKRRTDALELGQLAAWFAGVAKLSSPVARAYLTALVLTGARREEMAALRWDAVDLRWRKLTIADKVGDTRAIPLTPYLQALIEGLPKATLPDGKPNPYVFAGIGKSGRIAEPRSPHQQVLTDAGIPHVSIHGLRRTFALMGEQAGAPAGAIAQVMGHRPSAVHEGYKPRSIDALRPYLERVESFVLQAAGVDFTQPERRGAGLRLVVGAAG